MDKDARPPSGSLWQRAMGQYEQMVMENHERLSTFDSMLRIAAYFLPSGRFGDAELQYEAGQVVVNLVSFFNDLILVKYFFVNPRFHDILSRRIPSPDSMLFTAAKALTTLHYTELFAEMLATKKWKEKGQWTVIVTIETLRACIRLAILLQTNGSMLIQQTIPQRDVLLGRPRNGPLRRTHPTPRRRLHTTDNLFIINNMLVGCSPHVVDHVLQVAALYKSGRKSWRPWLIAMGLDVLSRILTGSTRSLSDQECDEVARRTAHWWWAFLRAPCFDAILRNEHLQFLGGLGRMPLLGALFRSLLDYIQRYRQYYFYTAASS